MSCDVGSRHGSYPALLWLWLRLAAAALTGSLPWELPYAGGADLRDKKKKTKKTKKKQKKTKTEHLFFYLGVLSAK